MRPRAPAPALAARRKNSVLFIAQAFGLVKREKAEQIVGQLIALSVSEE